MMRLIYFVQYYTPEKAAGLPLVEDLLEGFTQGGWDVDLFTPIPTRGVTEKERNFFKKNRVERKYDGRLTIHRMLLYREGKGFVTRAIRYIIFSLQCLWKGFTEPGEVVFTGSGPPTQGVVGGLIRIFTKKKFIYNLQDIFPDSLVNTGMTDENSFLWKFGRRLENFAYCHADHIIVISEDFRKNLLKKGVPDKKITVVSNWVNTDHIYPVLREDNKLIQKYNLNPEFFYICYSGNIGYTQNIQLLVETAEELKKSLPNVNFIVIGDGAAKADLEKMVEEKALDNMILLPYQPYEDIAHVFSLGDAGLIISKAGVGDNSVPSKTWDIMSAARPVLASFDENSELTRIIHSAHCGIAVPADNKEELVKAIKELYENQQKSEEAGRNGRKYLKQYLDRRECVNRYVEVANQVQFDSNF